MDITPVEIIGTVNVIVYKTPEGDKFFEIKDNNDDLFPITNVIEDLLVKYH